MNFFREAELKEPVQKAHAFRLDDQATVQLRLQIRQAPRLIEWRLLRRKRHSTVGSTFGRQEKQRENVKRIPTVLWR